VVAELDGELDSFRDYRLGRVAARLLDEPLEGLFMLWNDSPWRRKQDVLSVLNNLADRLETEWNEAEQIRHAAEREAEHTLIIAERDRLTAEVSQLRSGVEALKEKIRDLEEENGLLKRLTSSVALRSDRRTLEELSNELEDRWSKLNELPELPVEA
jgi:hypothetical protein